MAWRGDRRAGCGGQWLGGAAVKWGSEGDKGDMSYIRCHLPEVQRFQRFVGEKRQNADLAENKILFRSFETKFRMDRASAAMPLVSK